jgi:phage tail tape-measure protein
LLAVGFQGARILGRRIWNSLTGKENNTVEEDITEFAESAIESGASAGLTVAVTGGVTVAAKSGWLGSVLKNTPVGRIASAVCIGVENVKILANFAAGNLTGEEALDKAGDATCSLVGSLALGAKGASVGAAIGSVFGPVGTAIGSIAGGIIGGMAGSTIGHAIWEGGKKIVKTVVNAVKSIATGLWEGAKAIGRGLLSLFGW